MIEPFLRAQLEPIVRRRRRWQLSRELTLCWGAAAAISFSFLAVSRLTGRVSPWVIPALAIGALAATLVAWRRTRRVGPDYRQIARQIEQRHPELHALLLTAVEQQPDPSTGQFNFLQQRLIQEAIRESGQTDWKD